MHKDEAETFGTHWLGISKRSLATVVRRSVLALLLLELAFLLRGGVLVLLVLRHEVVHVGLGLGELHLVHAFASVPDIVSFDAGKRLRI